MSSNRSELTSCFYQRMEWTLQDRTLGNLVLVGVIVADIITKSQMFIERLSTCSSKPPNMHDRCNRNTGTLNRAMRNSETANRKKSLEIPSASCQGTWEKQLKVTMRSGLLL